MAKWLLAHGFKKLPTKATGHWHFVHEPSRIKVQLMGHGPADLTKKHVALILRQLSRAGFDAEAVRKELKRL